MEFFSIGLLSFCATSDPVERWFPWSKSILNHSINLKETTYGLKAIIKNIRTTEALTVRARYMLIE